jgi:hypothetical protein
VLGAALGGSVAAANAPVSLIPSSPIVGPAIGRAGILSSRPLPVAATAAGWSRRTWSHAIGSIDVRVLDLALSAANCAARAGAVAEPRTLSVIDFSRPSSEKRLWVYELASGRLLFEELVAHGAGSGDAIATAFSNTPESHRTSLGLFATAETYLGQHGYSLRLDGLDPGFNDLARARAIVMHGASYVSEAFARAQGRIGRSWGCPALDSGVARAVIDQVKGGSLLFAYYPDPDWLSRSRFLACGG